MSLELDRLAERIGSLEAKMPRTARRDVSEGHLHKPKYNLTATVAPTVTDDINSGYEPGSIWIDLTGDNAYTCVDNTVGAAIWRQTTSSYTVLIAASNATPAEKAIANYRCDGVADNVEINAAIAALPAGGGTIILSSGDFYLAASISVTVRLFLRGQGTAITTLHLANTINQTMITSPQLAIIYSCQFSDFTLDGNKANNATGHGINTTGMNAPFLNNIVITSIAQDGLYADTAILNSDGLIGYNVRIASCGRHGWNVRGTAGWHLTSCTGNGNAVYGFLFDVASYEHHIVSCEADGANQIGWGLISATRLKMTNIWAGAASGGIATGLVFTGTCQDADIDGINAYGNAGAGIAFTDSAGYTYSQIQIRGLNSRANGSAGISMPSVSAVYTNVMFIGGAVLDVTPVSAGSVPAGVTFRHVAGALPAAATNVEHVPGVTAHGLLTGLANDDHTQYALLAGRAAGQSLIGGIAASENLTLQSTAHATRGVISVVDDLKLTTAGKSILDSGGTARISLAIASPNIALAGDVTANGTLAMTSTATGPSSGIIQITPTVGAATNWAGIVVSPSLTFSGAAGTCYAIKGLAQATLPTAQTTTDMYGLNFQVTAVPQNGGTSNLTNAASIFTITKFGGIVATGTNVKSGTITTFAGSLCQLAAAAATIGASATNAITITTAATFWAKAASITASGTNASVAITDLITGLYAPAVAYSSAAITVQNAYGLKIEDISGTSFTNKRVVEFGSSTPTTTSGLFRMVGNFTAAANQTPIYISEGATPTLRQLKTKDGAAIGAGDLVCVLV